uniref:Phospholipase A2 n=1 Tax=Pristhesancus plagipennis TaxID=1955184 RepID=A0A2K8JLT8_PRIPG|nr:secreted PLA2 protein [Pristhesancus plagipennis]
MKTAFILIILFCLPLNIFARTRVLSVTLPDGELFTYFQRGSLSAKQTSIKDLPEDVLMIRQVTDGKELIQAIYSEGTLVDCDLRSRQSEAEQLEIEINHIMSTMNNSNNNNNDKDNTSNRYSIEWSSGTSNITRQSSVMNSSWQVPREELTWFNISKLKRECLSSQERTISSLVKSRSRRSLLTIKPSRHGRKNKGKKRRRHDRLAKGKKQGLKQKLIPPGTNWCGPSNRALKFGDLGGFWKADKCCRKHDTCGMYILPFSNKYSKVNTSPFTLSHCSCDHRFRNCLKMANTGASNLVGKLFFNYVQTKCFVLKPEKICTKRSWWGKCQKHEYKKLAHIRNNLSY